MYSNLSYLIKALKAADFKDEDVAIAKGKYEYPKTFTQAIKKLWQ